MVVSHVFVNDSATTEIYTLSLHDALPIYVFPFQVTTYRLTEHHTAGGMSRTLPYLSELQPEFFVEVSPELAEIDRKSTRLNSSHANISYAVFCLKKKKKDTAGEQSAARLV